MARPLASLIQAGGRGGLRTIAGRYLSPASLAASNGTAAIEPAGSTTDAAGTSETMAATSTSPSTNVTTAAALGVNFTPAGGANRMSPSFAPQAGSINVGRPGGLSSGLGGAMGVSGIGAMDKLGNVAGQISLAGGGIGMSPGQMPVVTLPAKFDKGPDAVDAFPGLDEESQKVFQKLHDDLQAIMDKSEVTPKLEAAVRKDFEKIQSMATSQPDDTKVKALMDATEGVQGQLPSEEQTQQIKDAFVAVVKSQGITDQSLIDQTISDIQAVNKARNVTAEDLATLAADHKAIADHLASLASSTTGGFSAVAPEMMPISSLPFGGLGGM